MKDFIKQKFNIIMICITIMVVSIAGFSFAYATDENRIYTRDELSEKVYDTGWVNLAAYFSTNVENYPNVQSKIRRIGDVVYLIMDVTGISAVNGTSTTFLQEIPTEFRPNQVKWEIAPLGAVGANWIRYSISNAGTVSSSINTLGTLPVNTRYMLYTSFLAN